MADASVLFLLNADPPFCSQITNCFATIPLLQRLFQPFVTVEDLIPHLVYQSNGRHSLPVDIYERSLVLLFKSRLESYLRGVGHPLASKGELVTTEQWEREKDDPLVRARLLLDAAWALPRPPAAPMWEIRVSLHNTVHVR